MSETKFELSEERVARIEREMDRVGKRSEYDAKVANGMAPTLAEMVVMRQCCAIGSTDTTFNRRERSRMLDMSERDREVVTAIARKAGINTTGKTYNGQLGKYQDPHAWVSDTHDVRQAAKAKGLSLGGGGMVHVENEPKPVKKHRIAPDILNNLEVSARNRDPSLDHRCRKSTKSRNELRESLIEKHAPKKR